MIDLLLHNLRTIGIAHCDQSVGEEAADEIVRLRQKLAGYETMTDKTHFADDETLAYIRELEQKVTGMESVLKEIRRLHFLPSIAYRLIDSVIKEG
ncbi:MAG: hypothetical protein KGI54_13755 [Pseudomonadota bacterium]|nr:hypothetical protein [Pseudomonadota bacterium]